MDFKTCLTYTARDWSHALCTQGHTLKEEFQTECKEVFIHHDSWNKLFQRGCTVSILGGFENQTKP